MNEKTNNAPDFTSQVAAPAHADGCPQVVSHEEFLKHKSELENAAETVAEPEENERDKYQWYVMRSSYCRELKAKALLEADGFRCYVPTQTVREEKKGEVKTKTKAIVHNLVFIYTTSNIIEPWKKLHEDDAGLRYYMDKSQGKPMVIEEKTMEDFIRVTQDSDEGLLFLDNPDVVLTHGQPVEVILGPFKGVQGHVLRIRKDRRVVVSLNGIVSAVLSTMPQSYFKIIK